MWYSLFKKSSDYDLNDLNKEVKIDDAYNDILEALETGKPLDLSNRGFKAIRVNPPISHEEEEDIPIDIHNPRKNRETDYRYFEGISLNSYQGIAFASQALLKMIKKMMPTMTYIGNDILKSESFFKQHYEVIQKIQDRLIALDEEAQMQMTRDNDFEQLWNSRGSKSEPIWSARSPMNQEWLQSVDGKIKQENEWSEIKSETFWRLWTELRREMFEFLDFIPYPNYKELWKEFIPV